MSEVGKQKERRSILPGFGLTLGFTVIYLSQSSLIPISTIFFKTSALMASVLGGRLTPRTLAAYKLSFGASMRAR